MIDIYNPGRDGRFAPSGGNFFAHKKGTLASNAEYTEHGGDVLDAQPFSTTLRGGLPVSLG